MAVAHGVGSLRAAVVEIGAHWSRAQQRLVRLLVALDDSGEWAADGSPTCAHWVAGALDVEVCTAREWLRIGRALRELPAIDGAFDRGDVSYSKVRALTRVANPANEAELCEIARRVPAGRLCQALAVWLAQHETPEETATRQRKATHLTFRTDPDGMIVGVVRARALRRWRDCSRPSMPGSGEFRPDASADASERWPSIARQRRRRAGGTRDRGRRRLADRDSCCTSGATVARSTTARRSKGAWSSGSHPTRSSVR